MSNDYVEGGASLFPCVCRYPVCIGWFLLVVFISVWYVAIGLYFHVVDIITVGL